MQNCVEDVLKWFKFPRWFFLTQGVQELARLSPRKYPFLGDTFGLHHILFPHPGLYPWSTPHLHPQAGGKRRTLVRTEVTTPLILGLGSSNMQDFLREIISKNAGKNYGNGRQEQWNFFLEKNIHVPKKSHMVGNPFLKELFSVDKNSIFCRHIG